MRKLSRIVIALLMVITMVVLLPMQVLADSQKEYISEVKVFTGSYAEAEKEGYKILTDGNNAIDLNQKAGGGMGSKGEKAVYLGYKTTTESKEAITDLALMNMKGGYSVEDYEALMEIQMKSQIIPFVESFLAAIEEYRENYNSDNEDNRARAQYVHDVLNKLLDDDCGDAGLGDLLLNKTKYEMGDAAYNKLSDSEKKKHVDILTLIAQSNGQATIMLYSTISMACDTNEESWIDRFSETTYDDLLEETGLAPSKAKKELAKLYDDDAQDILANWDDLKDVIDSFDEKSEIIEEAEDIDVSAIDENVKTVQDSESFNEESFESFVDVMKDGISVLEYADCMEDVTLVEYLGNVEYGDGTLLDFFLQDRDDVADDITMLYPLVASLSDGQRSLLEYVSLKKLVSAAGTAGTDYDVKSIASIQPASVYTDVDRAIYQNGGVALTSDAMRSDAMNLANDANSSLLSPLTMVFWGLTAASAAGFAASIVTKFRIDGANAIINAEYTAALNTSNLNEMNRIIARNQEVREGLNTIISTGSVPKNMKITDVAFDLPTGESFANYEEYIQFSEKEMNEVMPVKSAAAKTSNIGNSLSIGFGVAMVILAGVSTYLTYQDMKAYYKVDFTPIPNYIVDEKDLVTYNAKGEKIILKNQSAYYKAAQTNRTEDDEFFNVLGVSNDINGDVGKQWLSLYSVKNKAEDPILASSLKAVVGDSGLPAGYETGIHTFGSEAAFNLNNSMYVWNSSAPEIYVYFKRDAGNSAKNNAGSNFTSGTVALSGGAGLVIGALGVVLTNQAKKKKETSTATA